jgi:hypothetical protein
MSKINFILGGDSITVFLDGKTFAVNKQAHTFKIVLDAVRSGNLDNLRAALDVRSHIAKALTAKSDTVRIVGSQIFYGDREVTGLIASRVFEVIRLGLDVTPMVKFLENLMSNPSKRAVDELFGFLEACELPLTDDGHFLAYKRVRSDYRDCHSGTMDNSVGKTLSMPRNLVDEDKNRTCSTGLHFCSYEYLASFGGDRIMILKINPADVVAIPSDYNNSKGRTCKYEVVDELPLDEYKMPENKITPDYTTSYGGGGGWDEPEVAPAEDDEYEDSFEESDESEFEESDDEENELDDEDIELLISDVRAGDDTLDDIADTWGIYLSTLQALMKQNGVTYASDKVVEKTPLTPNQVREIRKRLANGETLAGIARLYRVHPRSIGRIRDGEAWSNI